MWQRDGVDFSQRPRGLVHPGRMQELRDELRGQRALPAPRRLDKIAAIPALHAGNKNHWPPSRFPRDYARSCGKCAALLARRGKPRVSSATGVSSSAGRTSISGGNRYIWGEGVKRECNDSEILDGGDELFWDEFLCLRGLVDHA